MKKRANQNNRHIAARFVFAIYFALMLWLLFGQRMGSISYEDYHQQLQYNINLTPLKTLKQYIRLTGSSSGYLVRHAYVNLLGNVLLFVPLGYYLPCIWKRLRSFFKTLLCVTLVMAAVEAVQYYTLLGSCDIDDLILNLMGAAAGYGFWRLTAGRNKRKA
jgi:glycopeptide antibiotics resistance protein